MAEAQRDLSLIYEGSDITDQVDIIECSFRDGRKESDCLNLLLDHAENWFRWKPQKNDKLQVKRSGYDTGTLYLSAIRPEDGAYRIFATANKTVRPACKSESYEDKTLFAIASLCAGSYGMSARLYGINGAITYEYLLKDHMSDAEFLRSLAEREGAVLKAINGTWTLIGIEYAQSLTPMHKVNLESSQLDSTYTSFKGERWGGLTVKAFRASGQAKDGDASGQIRKEQYLCVDNDAQAKRWARGLLLSHNRESEILRLEMDFNPGYTAMVRIDVDSRSDSNGEWIIDEVTQDMLNGRTRAKLLRCVKSIA